MIESPADDTLPDSSEDTVHPRNKLNRLSGKQWLYFTRSVLRTTYPSILGHEQRKKQGGNKPPQLMQHFIEFFTAPGETVLDPFAGAGGTLLGVHLAGRQGLGIEINPTSIELYQNVCQSDGIEPMPVMNNDCRIALTDLADSSVDFVATDPPYSIRVEHTMSGDGPNTRYDRANRRSGYVNYSE